MYISYKILHGYVQSIGKYRLQFKQVLILLFNDKGCVIMWKRGKDGPPPLPEKLIVISTIVKQFLDMTLDQF